MMPLAKITALIRKKQSSEGGRMGESRGTHSLWPAQGSGTPL